MGTILEIRDLYVEFHSDEHIVHAVNGIHLKLREKETLGLVGETGAGKTTTALSIMQLISSPPGKITRGEILFEGDDLLKKPAKEMRKIRGNKISMIFQDPMTALNPVLTVSDQIAEVIRNHQKCSRAQALQQAVNMMQLVGIPAERGREYPHQFSGGMKQRIVIAIALACNPHLLIADEPTTALDVTIQAQVLRMMKKMRDQFATSMLLITHDLGVVAEICDRVAIMYAGEIVEYGSLAHIFKNPQHPYTKGLFDSLPRLEEDVRRLRPINGLMPDPTNLPSGCKFHGRCPFCMEKCTVAQPVAVEVEPGHQVQCWLVTKGAENE